MSLTITQTVTELHLTIEQNGETVLLSPVVTKNSEITNIDGGNASTTF